MRGVSLVIRWWCLFVGAWLFAGMAVAQPDGNQIISAHYGTAERNVDVTDRLRQLARENRTFKLGNDTFGIDPDEGRVKTLRIHLRTGNGGTRYYDYTEGSIVDGSRFAGWGGGNWGQGAGSGNWREPGSGYGGGKPYEGGGGYGGGHGGGGSEYRILNARYGTAQRNVDVTDRLRELARADRTFRLGNDTFGIDPDEGRVKTLRIYARSPGGGTRTFEYREGTIVDGSQFSGWGGGDWGQGGGNGGWGGSGGGSYRGLEIVRATYGTGFSTMDVTDRLRSMAGDGRINIKVGNDELGGDPAPNRPKVLTVWYTNGGRGERQARVNEGGRLILP